MRSLPASFGLLAALVALSTAQLPFGPVFHLNQYDVNEGGQVVVRLSAPILSESLTSPFTGSIKVDITTEDLPSGDTRQNAQILADYLVNTQNPLSRTFTVVFQSKQANSSEHVIQIADDNIFEGSEAFRLRIVNVRFIGQAGAHFRTEDGVNSTVVDVTIADNDFINVNWTMSRTINVTEGDGMEVRLSAQAIGIYENPIIIGVFCEATDVTGVEPAHPGKDFNFTLGSKLEFTSVHTQRSSSNQVVIPIINDDLAEPCESFICTLQGGASDSIRIMEPNQRTVEICDDDQLIVNWARGVYEFFESQEIATVQLVTHSKFEATQLDIQGFPRQIPDGHPNRFPSLMEPGPAITGYANKAIIERVYSSYTFDELFGNAQVTQSGRTDVVNTINDFIFTPTSKSALENFTIVDDDVLEFDEIFIAEFDFGPEILNGGWNARKGEPSTAFIVIRDDDTVVVNFNENSYTVAEIDGQVSISLRIDGQFFVPVWAVVTINDGTATDPQDYSSAKRYNVTFRQTALTDREDPACTTVSSPILINIVNDDFSDEVEYFQAQIVETSDQLRVKIGQSTVNVTISDFPFCRLMHTIHEVREDMGSLVVTVMCNVPSQYPFTLIVRTSDGTAVDGADYNGREFPVSFSAGSTKESFSVSIVDDVTFETDKTFFLTLVIPQPAQDIGVMRGDPYMATVTIINDEELIIMQLYLRPVTDCLTWVETNSDAKLSDISAALSVPLQQQCGCSLSVQQSHFSCANITDSQTVVFIAELSYTALPGVDMPSLLTSWVTSTPHITVASTQLQVDTTCPVVINSLEPESCPITSVAPPTESPTETVTVIVTVCGIVILLVVTAIVVIVIAVVVCCRKRSKHRPSCPLPSPVYEDEYVDKGDVALDMTRNPSYMTAKEVLSVRFACGTEENKEVDHTYEVVSLEANKGGHEGTTSAAGGGQKATV